MYNCEFPGRDKDIIEKARLYDSSPVIRKRMSILWYKSLGYPHHEIAQLSSASENTITATIRSYLDGGLDKVMKRRPYRPQSELQDHRYLLKKHFSTHPPGSLKEAGSEIEKLTGIKRSLGSVRTFLLSLGMYRRKVGMVPAKGDPDEQEAFINNKLQPVLDKAIAGERHVYFVDAAHFVLAPFLGFLWSFTRLFIKAPAGRKRFNVLGALNAVTHEIVTVTNDTYIDAISVCALLRKIAACHIAGTITLILDNAKYQKCCIVAELAKDLKIDLLYLPPYSPNLNLIERLWRYVKKKSLYSKYYEDFPKFKNAISDCLSEANTRCKREMETLFSLRFQRIRKSQIISI
jgi:transposase